VEASEVKVEAGRKDWEREVYDHGRLS